MGVPPLADLAVETIDRVKAGDMNGIQRDSVNPNTTSKVCIGLMMVKWTTTVSAYRSETVLFCGEVIPEVYSVIADHNVL